jgi:hypothetical protein
MVQTAEQLAVGGTSRMAGAEELAAVVGRRRPSSERIEKVEQTVMTVRFGLAEKRGTQWVASALVQESRRAEK